MLRTPSVVAKVLMLYRRSPSTSARSFVMAITIANTVTKQVMNLQAGKARLRTMLPHLQRQHECSILLLDLHVKQ